MFTEYRDNLFKGLEEQLNKTTKLLVLSPDVPTLASTGEQLTKEQVIARQTTRGIKRKPYIMPEEDQEVEGSRRRNAKK